eukprot:gene15493-21577_t
MLSGLQKRLRPRQLGSDQNQISSSWLPRRLLQQKLRGLQKREHPAANLASRECELAAQGVGFPKHIQRAPACRPRVTVKPCAAASRELSTASKPEPLTILVLGGTGFVGSAFIKAASAKGHKVISLSRRGRPPADAPQTDENVEWVQGDATEYKAIEDVVSSHPDINACFHCIGLLLDEASGLSNLNKMASGSGSVPSANSFIRRHHPSDCTECHPSTR